MSRRLRISPGSGAHAELPESLLARMPSVLLSCVFTWLDSDDHVSLSSTAAGFRRVGRLPSSSAAALSLVYPSDRIVRSVPVYFRGMRPLALELAFSSRCPIDTLPNVNRDMPHFSGLRSVKLSRKDGVRWEDLASLPRALRSLHVVSVAMDWNSASVITPAVIEHLPSTLADICIGDNLTVEQVGALAALTHLERLSFQRLCGNFMDTPRLPGAQFPALRVLRCHIWHSMWLSSCRSRLEHLDLSGGKWGIRLAIMLGACTRLVSLNLSNCELTDPDLTRLCAVGAKPLVLASVQSLMLDDNGALRDFVCLELTFPSLTRLSVARCATGARIAEPVPASLFLTYSLLRQMGAAVNVGSVGNAGSTDTADARTLKPIVMPVLSFLRDLDVRGTRQSAASAAEAVTPTDSFALALSSILSLYPSLVRLRLSCNGCSAARSADRTGSLVALAGLTALHTLDLLECTNLPDGDLGALLDCASLRVLVLTPTIAVDQPATTDLLSAFQSRGVSCLEYLPEPASDSAPLPLY